jgi:hypothetical protein
MTQEIDTLDLEAERIINEIGLPPCPAILTTLMREMRADDPDFVKLGKLIGSDVSLAAAMLKTVNSPFYGLRSKASSVQQAIALLGLRNVAEMVTGLLLRQTFTGGASEVLEEFWEVSSAVAVLSALLARELRGKGRDEAYTFALFRDCGMLAMLGNFDAYKPQLPGSKAQGEGSVTEIEEQLHGVHHARLGPGCGGLQALDLPCRLDHFDRRHGGTGIAPNHARQHIAQQAVIGHRPKVQIQPQAGLGQAGTFQQAGQLAKGRAGIEHRWSRKTCGPLRLGAADQHRRRFSAINPRPDIGGFHPVAVGPHMGLAQGLPSRR